MTIQHDRPTTDLPTTGQHITAGKIHVDPPVVDNAPPTRSKVTAAIAAIACALWCALPLLITAGVLTGAGAALAQNLLLAGSGVLVAAAAGMWWLHRRRNARKAATVGQTGWIPATVFTPHHTSGQQRRTNVLVMTFGGTMTSDGGIFAVTAGWTDALPR